MIKKQNNKEKPTSQKNQSTENKKVDHKDKKTEKPYRNGNLG